MCGTPYVSQRISVLVAAAFWASGAGADSQPARTRAATRTDRYNERTRRARERVMDSLRGSGSLAGPCPVDCGFCALAPREESRSEEIPTRSRHEAADAVNPVGVRPRVTAFVCSEAEPAVRS